MEGYLLMQEVLLISGEIIAEEGAALALGTKPYDPEQNGRQKFPRMCLRQSEVRYSSYYDWLPRELDQVSSPGARLGVEFSLRCRQLSLGICM